MTKKDKNSLLNMHYSRTLTPNNLSKAANYVGEYVLNGLETLGRFLNAGFTSPTYGTTGQVSYARNAEDAKRLRELLEASEQAMGKAMTWVSPLNYGAALATGNGLNARKGEEEVASWTPAWQAVGRLGELYVGPKAVKGVKATPRVVVNTAAKAGVKPAKATVIAREIKQATKNKPNLSNRTYTENNGNYTLFSPFGEDIGNLLTTKPLTSEMKGKGISMISSKNKGKGVSEDLYNIAVEDSKIQGYPGLESGHDLFRPKLTMHVTDKFPKIETPNVSLQNINGKWQFAPDLNLPPIRLLIGNSGKPIPSKIQELTNHRINLLDLENQRILFNEATGNFEMIPKEIKQEPRTSLKFFERKPARISEAERAGVPKGERNLTISERDYPVGTAQLYIRRGAIAKMDDASRYASEMFKKGDFERVHLDETIRIPDKFSPDGYHLHAKTKRNYYFSKTDPYANNRLKGNWKTISKYNDREGNVFLGEDLPKEFYDYLEQIKDAEIHPNFTNLKSENIIYPYKQISLFGSKIGEIKANEILPKYVRDFRLYLDHLGYNTSNVSDYQILLLLTDLYKMLTKSMSGKTKGLIFWHEGPKYNEVFDFSHTGENTGNMGALGPGNYFSSGDSAYGEVAQPYLITGIKETPIASLSMIDKGLIPEYISPSLSGVNVRGSRYFEYLHSSPEERLTYPQDLRELYENALAKVKERIATTPVESSRLWIDPALIKNSGVAPRLSLTKIKPMEFMLRRNTGIKSLFPHPSTFTRDANGRIIINRNWEDPRVNYKQGGKMNIIEFLKNGSGIHIKKKNRGKFTSYCGGKVTDKCILKGKNSSNPAIRKRATFAANARKWKHKKGGNILFKLRRYLEGGLTTNNKFDYGQIINVASDVFSTILLNKAVDASIKNLKALTELLKKKLFYNNYKSLLGLQLDRSPIVNLNRAYIQANNMSDVSDIDQLFLNQEQELLNLKLKNTSRLISSIGGLALSYFSSLGNKNQISTTSKNNPTSSSIGKTYTTEITKPFNNTADEWRQLIIN